MKFVLILIAGLTISTSALAQNSESPAMSSEFEMQSQTNQTEDSYLDETSSGVMQYHVRPPWRIPAPRRQWLCYAQDRAGYYYRNHDWNKSRARYEVMAECGRRTRSGSCRFLGCR